MQDTYNSPQEWLTAILQDMRKLNPKFSLRQMAKLLGIAPGRLSEYLAGKRAITSKQAEKFFDRLEYSTEKRDHLRSLFLNPDRSRTRFALFSDDSFRLVAEGSHLAFLCLMDVPGFRTDEDWLAARLQINKDQVRDLIGRLERAKLIQWTGQKLERRREYLSTTTDISSEALRASHKESLAQAANALDTIALELRDITSITMAIDPAQLPAAKKQIQAFRRKMCAFLQKGVQKQVYNLNVQLVPVTTLETT